MTKRALSLLLCLVMIFSLSIGCMTSANALELSDVAAALPVITGQPQDAVIEETGSATFTVRTVFDDLLDQIKNGDFDLEAWLSSMLEHGLDLQTIIGILEEMGFNWSDIIDALLNSGIDWEQILKALQDGGFDLEEILGQLAQNPEFDLTAILGSLIGSSDVDISALLAILQQLIGGATPLTAGDVSPAEPVESDVEALLAALLGDKLTPEMIEQIKAALDGSADLDAVIAAIEAKLGTDVDITAIVKAIQDATGGEFDLAALIEALQGALGEDVDLSEIVKAIQDAMGGELDMEALVKALQEVLGEDVDLSEIVKIIQGAVGGELDTEALIQALIAAFGDQLDLQALIEALQEILGEDLDLEALIKALINGGFDLDTILEILQQMGYTPEMLLDLLIGKLISYQWYTRVGEAAVPVTAAVDANDYDGAATKTLTVTRTTAPAKTEQYTYFCTVALADVTYTSKDAVLTIHVTPDQPELNKESHMAYIRGYEDGTVRPEANITRAETAQIFYNLLTEDSREVFHATSCAFYDVPDGQWYTTCVATLAKAGILRGYEDGSFRPSAPITRAEMATIIARFAELKESKITFRDIQGHWAQKNIELAASNGWILGYPDGTFRPDQNIKRDETVAMVNRVLDRNPLTAADLLPGMKTFTDNTNPVAWYYVAIQEAANSHEYTRNELGIESWTNLIAS
ncbi:MAG: S-layer homology domain-containing protein [Oscillospiraceae bacterium]